MTREVTYENPAEMVAWAEAKLGVKLRDDAQPIGVRGEDGQILAVCVFDTWTDVGCSVHLASDGSKRWNCRRFIALALVYPFVQCRARRITAFVPASNAAALRFDRHFGFKDEGVMRDATPSDDIVVLGLLAADGLKIIEKYGKGA